MKVTLEVELTKGEGRKIDATEVAELLAEEVEGIGSVWGDYETANGDAKQTEYTIEFVTVLGVK